MHTHETPASDRADTSSADDTLHLYLREIARHPLLSRFEETELSKRVAAGDELARRRMVESNLRLVVTIARTFRGRGLDLLDLIQEGTVGLMSAVDRYDWRDVASVPAISLRVVSARTERFDGPTVTSAFGDNPGITHTP